MKNDVKFTFEKVTDADVANMTVIMKRAFDEDTRRHLGREEGGPPGYDNGEFIKHWYVESDSDAYKVIVDGILIGGVNIFRCGNHEYFLGNIFIDTDVQDKGYGTMIWKKIEEMYPDAVKWSTETPGFSKRNHNFYVNKCGFKVVGIENPKDIEKENYIFEKVL